MNDYRYFRDKHMMQAHSRCDSSCLFGIRPNVAALRARSSSNRSDGYAFRTITGSTFTIPSTLISEPFVQYAC